MTGPPLCETRTFQDGEAFTSAQVFSPLGALLEQTDAVAHVRATPGRRIGSLAELLHRGLLGSSAVAQLNPFDPAAAGTVLGEGAVAAGDWAGITENARAAVSFGVA